MSFGFTQKEVKDISNCLEDGIEKVGANLSALVYETSHGIYSTADKPKNFIGGVWKYISGRMFITHKPDDSLTGYHDKAENQLNGRITNDGKVDFTITYSDSGDILQVKNGVVTSMQGRQDRMEFAWERTLGKDETSSQGKDNLTRIYVEPSTRAVLLKFISAMKRVERLYSNITFKELSKLFGLPNELTETLVGCLMRRQQIEATLDQVEDLLIFNKMQPALTDPNQRIQEFGEHLVHICEAVVAKYPQRYQRV